MIFGSRKYEFRLVKPLTRIRNSHTIIGFALGRKANSFKEKLLLGTDAECKNQARGHMCDRYYRRV